MGEMIQRTPQEAAELAALGTQARMYSEGAAMNLMQLGGVLSRAKEKVPHGEWLNWVFQYTGMSDRTAQNCIKAYKRYGDKPQYAGIDKSKLFKMLSLPEGQEQQFIETHDVDAMSAREVGEAVKRAREEALAEAAAEIEAARRQAQQEPPEELVNELRAKSERILAQEREIARLQTVGKDAVEARMAAERNAKELLAERDSYRDAISEVQAQKDEAEQKLLEMKSAKARGDMDRQEEEMMSPAAFRQVVQGFLGKCCLLPQMGRSFGKMATQDLGQYGEALDALEKWAAGVRRAMNGIEGATFIE